MTSEGHEPNAPRETILFLEDEALVLWIWGSSCVERDFRAYEASDANEAIGQPLLERVNQALAKGAGESAQASPEKDGRSR